MANYMGTSGMKMVGSIEVRRRLKESSTAKVQQTFNALIEDSKETLDLAKSRTPVRTGELRDSGRLEDPFIEDGTLGIGISFGAGLKDPRAIVQHENLDFNHKVGQAKYLESAVQDRSSGLTKRVAARLGVSRL